MTGRAGRGSPAPARGAPPLSRQSACRFPAAAGEFPDSSSRPVRSWRSAFLAPGDATIPTAASGFARKYADRTVGDRVLHPRSLLFSLTFHRAHDGLRFGYSGWLAYDQRQQCQHDGANGGRNGNHKEQGVEWEIHRHHHAAGDRTDDGTTAADGVRPAHAGSAALRGVKRRGQRVKPYLRTANADAGAENRQRHQPQAVFTQADHHDAYRAQRIADGQHPERIEFIHQYAQQQRAQRTANLERRRHPRGVLQIDTAVVQQRRHPARQQVDDQ